MRAALSLARGGSKPNPMRPELTDAEQDFVIEVLREAVGE